MSLHFEFNINKENKTVNVIREFAASLEQVWDAWTKPEILDLWWAPKPYKTETKSMDFREGGQWLYCMVSPEGQKHWCLNNYRKINHLQNYIGLDAFCDENGVINEEFPRTEWNNTFESSGEKTTVNIVAVYEKLEDLEKIISLGFQEGFTMAMGNLDEVLAENSK
jgi:uncharacterized protein YndB with AHSA1/START domain